MKEAPGTGLQALGKDKKNKWHRAKMIKKMQGIRCKVQGQGKILYLKPYTSQLKPRSPLLEISP